MYLLITAVSKILSIIYIINYTKHIIQLVFTYHSIRINEIKVCARFFPQPKPGYIYMTLIICTSIIPTFVDRCS